MTDLARPADPLDAVGRLEALRAEIAQRARDCGRDPQDVRLVAVSKTFSADDVWPTIARGGRARIACPRPRAAVAISPIERDTVRD